MKSLSKHNLLIVLLSLLFSPFLVGCGVFGMHNYEEPQYKVLIHEQNMEIREYSSRILAQVNQKGSYKETSNSSFRKLAAYIFVENQKSIKMKMTAPVLQEPKESGWIMSFVLPQNYDAKTLPLPLDNTVSIAERPPQVFAVLKFSGFVTESKMKNLEKELKEWIVSKGYTFEDTVVTARYDPPWTIPFLRRNEIQLRVVLKEKT